MNNNATITASKNSKIKKIQQKPILKLDKNTQLVKSNSIDSFKPTKSFSIFKKQPKLNSSILKSQETINKDQQSSNNINDNIDIEEEKSISVIVDNDCDGEDGSLNKSRSKDDSIILNNKFFYNKNGKIVKSIFMPPEHIFPENSEVITSSEYTIIVSPFFKKIDFFKNYITIVSPSYESNIKRDTDNSNNLSNISNKNTILGKERNNSNSSDSNNDTNNTNLNNDLNFEFQNSVHVCPSDFDILEVVGEGYYGKVSKVKYYKDNKIYALKSLKKSKLKEIKQREHTNAEKRILSNIKHPFIVSLLMSFQTEKKLYLVMEYLNGGELFHHIKKIKKMDESVAVFYLSQIVCALDFLHENHIIYRDLKPENIVLNDNGYIKLTDFGLSKEDVWENSTTQTFCGTPEYLSPEMIKGDPYNSSVDMWGLGILFYEILYGIPPFYDSNRDNLYKKIYFNEPSFNKPNKKIPSEVSQDFIRRLLCKNPKERMTIKEAKKHPIFNGFNFERLMSFEIEPPIIPESNVSLLL